MTARRSTGRSRPPVVLVFGESINDSTSIARLLVAANPALAGRVRARPRPTSLTREAKPPAVRSWVADLGYVVRATEATGDRVAGIVVHRDADGPDRTGSVAAELSRQLAALGGKAAVPVQAIEAWWFLFPDAVEAVRPRAWRRRLPRRKQDVELIERPKEALQRATRTRNGPEYAESDSPVIAEYIRRHSLRPLDHCASYSRLVTTAGEVS